MLKFLIALSSAIAGGISIKKLIEVHLPDSASPKWLAPIAGFLIILIITSAVLVGFADVATHYCRFYVFKSYCESVVVPPSPKSKGPTVSDQKDTKQPDPDPVDRAREAQEAERRARERAAVEAEANARREAEQRAEREAAERKRQERARREAGLRAQQQREAEQRRPRSLPTKGCEWIEGKCYTRER